MKFAVVAKFTFVLLTLACKERSFITFCPLTDLIEDYGEWELIIYSSVWVNKEVDLFWLRPKPHGVVAVLLLRLAIQRPVQAQCKEKFILVAERRSERTREVPRVMDAKRPCISNALATILKQ